MRRRLELNQNRFLSSTGTSDSASTNAGTWNALKNEDLRALNDSWEANRVSSMGSSKTSEQK